MATASDALIALRKIMRMTDLRARQLANSAGITATQLLVMQAVDVNEGITPSVIAKDFNLSQPTMTTILDRLEKKGYVERERCPADRRKILLHLNASGKAILSESSAALQDKFVSAFDGLEDWERSMLVASLQRIVNIMGADELDATPVLEWGQLSRNVEQADQ